MSMRCWFFSLLLLLPASAGPAPQGIQGQVVESTGDFMPGPEPPRGTRQGVARKVLVYRAARLDKQAEPLGPGGFYRRIRTPLVATTRSDAQGKFRVSLNPGLYTLVVEENGKLYANGTDGKYLNPVRVEQGKWTSHVFDINYKATY